MECIYVMDYSNCTISKLIVTYPEDDDIERILTDNNFNIDECAYMYCDEDINIEEIYV